MASFQKQRKYGGHWKQGQMFYVNLLPLGGGEEKEKKNTQNLSVLLYNRELKP